MREIKFRAWDKERLEMVEISLIHFDHQEPYLVVKDDYIWNLDPETDEAECVIDLKDCELMQYTGLKDKNGKEIYEGDILKRPWSVYTKGKPCGNSYLVVKWLFGSKKLGWNLVIGHNREIIGNIYENPELLKVK